MTHDQQKFANICWPTFIGGLHDTRTGKVGKQNDNMVDLEEDTVLAFLLIRHLCKKHRRHRRSTWVRSWIRPTHRFVFVVLFVYVLRDDFVYYAWRRIRRFKDPDDPELKKTGEVRESRGRKSSSGVQLHSPWCGVRWQSRPKWRTGCGANKSWPTTVGRVSSALHCRGGGVKNAKVNNCIKYE